MTASAKETQRLQPRAPSAWLRYDVVKRVLDRLRPTPPWRLAGDRAPSERPWRRQAVPRGPAAQGLLSGRCDGTWIG